MGNVQHHPALEQLYARLSEPGSIGSERGLADLAPRLQSPGHSTRKIHGPPDLLRRREPAVAFPARQSQGSLTCHAVDFDTVIQHEFSGYGFVFAETGAHGALARRVLPAPGSQTGVNEPELPLWKQWRYLMNTKFTCFAEFAPREPSKVIVPLGPSRILYSAGYCEGLGRREDSCVWTPRRMRYPRE